MAIPLSPPCRAPRRRVVLRGTAAAALLLAGCASVLGPRTIVVSEAQLLEAIARKFPFGIRLLDSVQFAAVSPRLRLLPEENRIATELDLNALEGLGGRPLKGTVGLSYGLRFEPADASIRLAQVRLDRLDFGTGTMASLLQGQGGRLAAALGERLLDGLPVYTLKPEDAERIRGHGYVPGDIRVTPAGLAITLQPKP